MSKRSKKVLVAPLDWGLGHATRSIPVIRELQLQGHEVLVASSGDALILLQREFPHLIFFELPSYRVTYSRNVPLIAKIILQLPKFIAVIWKEHRMVEHIVKANRIEAVVSDNRFGCWTRWVPTAFITHQVNIQLPPGLKWAQGFVNFFNHRQIKKFDRCWVPDFPEDRMTGRLSEPGKLSVKCVGMLSRFNKSKAVQSIAYDYLALISGPEPQRTIFEQKVRLCFSELKGRKMLVRGLPGMSEEIVKLSGWDEVCHLETEALQRIIEQSECVVCRSGYSSIMDLAALGKKAVFVPTPGQTEQEYLAEELMKKGIASYVDQRTFSPDSLQPAKGYTGFSPRSSTELLKKEIAQWLG